MRVDEATIRLIETHGDTQEALGVDATEFVRLWKEFVETNYPPGQSSSDGGHR